MPLGMEVGLGPGDFVLDGDSPALPKRKQSPNFRPMSLVAKRLDGNWHGGGPQSRPHGARWGPSSPKGDSPQFSAHVYCGQTAGWIKMPLGTEIDLSLCDIVLDGDPAPLSEPLKNRHTFTRFSADVYCGQAAGWMKTPLGTEVDLGPGHIVLHGDPAPPVKRAQQPLSFRPMSVVAPVVHLSYC